MIYLLLNNSRLTITMFRYYGQRYSSNPTCQAVQIKWESRVYGQITLPARSAFKPVPGTTQPVCIIHCSEIYYVQLLAEMFSMCAYAHYCLGVTVSWYLEAGADSISGSTGSSVTIKFNTDRVHNPCSNPILNVTFILFHNF
jgi:hypothetical protein